MRIVGHRGAKGEAPENTIAGFRHAYQYGIRFFEMDLVLSKDGVPVIIHDLTVDRTTPQRGKVCDFTASELTRMDARGSTPWREPTPIPTLEQVLEAIPDFEHLQFEVKTDAKSRLNVLGNRVVELIQQRGWYERVAITSTDTQFLKSIKRRDRRVKTGFVAQRRFPKPTRIARNLGCDYFCCDWHLADPATVAEAHRLGMQVSTWTVNRIHDMLILESNGVDSIITDYPTSASIYFENRLEVGGRPLVNPEPA